MEKQTFRWSKIGIFFITVLTIFSLFFGFGYFVGRYEQIELNKSLLKPIPDINCKN